MENTNIKKETINKFKYINSKMIIYLIFFIVSIYLGSRNFMVFHTLVEIFCIIIGFVMAIISINTHKLNKKNKIINLGIAFGFIACINLVHLFAYVEMPYNRMFTFDMAIQLWVLGSYLQSISLLIFLIKEKKEDDLKKVIITYLIILMLNFFFIFKLKVFPRCYIEGSGFTCFKLITNYINCAVLVFIFIYIKNKKIDKINKTNEILSFSILANIMCELFFIFSSRTYDIFSILGHVFQMLMFYYIYIALVQSSLQEPHYSLIELNNILSEKNQNLESLVDKLRLEHNKRKIIEEEREKKKQILDGILESVLDGVIVVNNSGRILHSNNNFIKMLNIPFKITNETTNSQVINFIKEQIKNPKDFIESIEEEWKTEEEYIKYIYLKDERIFETSSVPFNNNKIIKGRVIIYRDITEKRKTEMLKQQLEIRQASLEKAREFDELKSNFFCTVSHELKTPINIILGVVQLLIMKENKLETKNNLKFDKYIKMIKQNCYRLIKLSSNLIDITKIDAGYTEMKIKNHNIVSVIEDITLSVVDYVKSKDISLIFDTDIEEKIIACDAEQLERVMLNLLSNAIKFTNTKGKIEINVKDDKEFVIISVKDDGIGIPKEKTDIVFDRFRQVDPTLTREKEGSGIGLSLVKSIIEKHNGDISLISEVGKGSEFIIKLPNNLVDDNIEDGENEYKEINVEKIKIEFSDIYELNVY